MFVEPWFTPEDWHTYNIHALKISHMNLSEREGNLSRFVIHYSGSTLA